MAKDAERQDQTVAATKFHPSYSWQSTSTHGLEEGRQEDDDLQHIPTRA
jgi:hypothetical protein